MSELWAPSRPLQDVQSYKSDASLFLSVRHCFGTVLGNSGVTLRWWSYEPIYQRDRGYQEERRGSSAQCGLFVDWLGLDKTMRFELLRATRRDDKKSNRDIKLISQYCLIVIQCIYLWSALHHHFYGNNVNVRLNWSKYWLFLQRLSLLGGGLRSPSSL